MRLVPKPHPHAFLPEGPRRGLGGDSRDVVRPRSKHSSVIALSRTFELQKAQDPLNDQLLVSGNLGVRGGQDVKGQKVLQLWVS